MKAILVEKFVKNFSELQPKDVPRPTKPDGGVEVEITHATLSHVDMLYAQGLHQNNRRHVKPPFILGNEFAGIVTSAPPCSAFQPGDRVFGGSLGSYAEYICVDEKSIRKVPEQWSNAEACAVGASGAISWSGLMDISKLKAGETVLVLGATGGLGVMAVQIAKAVGAKVIAVVAGEEKAKMLLDIGADGVVDYHEPKWEEKVKALTANNEGVDVVYDSIGAIESGIRCLRYKGRLVIVGFAARGGKIEEVRANRILLKAISVIGYRFGEDGRRDSKKTQNAWQGFMALVKDAKIKPVIYTEAYRGLGELPRAMEDLKARRVYGRAVLRIDEKAEVEAAEKAKL